MRTIHAICALLAVLAAPVAIAGGRHSMRVELGRRLFYDADLSRDGTMSCGTCHEQRHGFGDGNRTHPGVTDEAGRRNVPGLANVGRFSPLTWADPRQTSLEKQVAVPLFGNHPIEMGMHGLTGEIPKRLGRDNCYRQMFKAAFSARGDAITFPNVAKALASFERSLISRTAPVDRHALSAEAKSGQKIFRQSCASCHRGKDLTDLSFHRLNGTDAEAEDQGLFEITGNIADRGRFRTPSLRNVAVTAPYWHDGSTTTLSDAIKRHEIALNSFQTNNIIKFLDTLTDTSFLTNPAFSLPQTACGKAL